MSELPLMKLHVTVEGGWKATHIHVKSGGHYRVIAQGACEWDLKPVVIYDDAQGRVWVRSTDEFFDGRFVVLP